MRQLVRLAGNVHLGRHAFIKTTLSANLTEACLAVCDVETVMWPRRARHGDGNVLQVDFHDFGIHARRIVHVKPQALRLRICFHESHLLIAAPGHTQEINRLAIDGEQRARAAVFGRHVGYAGTLRG